MFNNLTKVMDSNKEIWSDVKEIEKAYKAFLEETNKLNLLKDEYDKDLQKLIDRKNNARRDIIMQIFPISNIIVAFAIENKSKKVVKKYNFSNKELRKTKDIELVEYSKTIWKDAKKLYSSSEIPSANKERNKKPVSVNIHNYGLTEQMIDNLEIANATLVQARLDLKEALEYKKQCGKKITAGIGRNIQTLKRKLDLLMTIFKASNPGFYSDLVAARAIDKRNDTAEKKSEKSKANKNTNKSTFKTNQVHEYNEIEKDLNEIKTPQTKIKPVKKVIEKSTNTNLKSDKTDIFNA